MSPTPSSPSSTPAPVVPTTTPRVTTRGSTPTAPTVNNTAPQAVPRSTPRVQTPTYSNPQTPAPSYTPPATRRQESTRARQFRTRPLWPRPPGRLISPALLHRFPRYRPRPARCRLLLCKPTPVPPRFRVVPPARPQFNRFHSNARTAAPRTPSSAPQPSGRGRIEVNH